MLLATPKHYWLSRAGLADDFVAGILTGLILIPQALAYASLAGLPAHIGLYASLLPPVIYALLASSQVMSVGPVSVAALMVADAYSSAAVQTTADAISVSITLAFEVGLILLVLRFLKLGIMNVLLSHTVLSGFTSAAALLIIASQLDKFAGVNLSELMTTLLSVTDTPLTTIINTHALVIGIGLMAAALTVLAILGKDPISKWLIFAKRMVPLILLVSGVLLVNRLALEDKIDVVGAIPAIFPNFDLVWVDLATWRVLLPSALAIAFIAYIESLSVARILGSRRRESIDANRELLALGASNVAAGFSGAMPVAGGFSRSMVNHTSGAKTQRATLVTVLVIILVCTFAQNFIEQIPHVALAVIIILAVAPLFDIKTFKHTWRYDRGEAMVIAATFIGVFAIGLEFGLLLGVFSAFALYFKRSLSPHIAELGQLRDRPEYRNVLRYETRRDDDILILRVDEALYFANIELIEASIRKAIESHKEARHLLLVCNAVNHIDSHALEALQQLIRRLEGQGIAVHCAEVKGPVQDRLRNVGFEQSLAAKHFFFTIQDAVSYIRNLNENPKEGTHHDQEIS